jgi:hypothetical protein
MAGGSGVCLLSQLLREAQIGGLWSRLAQAWSKTYLKSNQHKKGWGKAQMV